MMTGFKQSVLGVVQDSVLLTSMAFAVDNFLAAAQLNAADPAPSEHLSGADIGADLEYARSVATRYLAHGKISGRVAEIGPGGSAAVALHLLSEGCQSVDLLDRFRFSHNPHRLALVYDEIIRNDPTLTGLFGRSRDLAPYVRFHVGEKAAAEVFFRTHKDYDAIVSCAVLEHLYDPLAALEAMAQALRPGGYLVHQVDFADHGMFTAGGHHELTFLKIPSWFYPHMSRRRGRPNRILAHRYRETLDRLELKYRILPCKLVGVGLIDPLPYDEIPPELRAKAEAKVEEFRPHMAKEFRNLPVSDLAVSAIFISAHKLLR